MDSMDIYRVHFPPQGFEFDQTDYKDRENKDGCVYTIACALEKEQTGESVQEDAPLLPSSTPSNASTSCSPWLSLIGIRKANTESVVILEAKEFKQLRERCGIAELAYIQSLKCCEKWDPQGGRSGAQFKITVDKRFIIKEIKKTELRSFKANAKRYFEHITDSKWMAKIFGIYQVQTKNLIVTENIFYGREDLLRYDLKGVRHRYTDKDGATRLDKNFISDMENQAYHVSGESLNHLAHIKHDISFLTSIGVMDYSLLVGKDEERKELVMGIIDYLRQYTCDKQVEGFVKKLLTFPNFEQPTSIPPKDYGNRLKKFVTEHLKAGFSA